MRDNVKSGALTEVTFFILLALYQARHGYAIMQFVEEKTKGRLIIGTGSLYGALESLSQKRVDKNIRCFRCTKETVYCYR